MPSPRELATRAGDLMAVELTGSTAMLASGISITGNPTSIDGFAYGIYALTVQTTNLDRERAERENRRSNANRSGNAHSHS